MWWLSGRVAREFRVFDIGIGVVRRELEVEEFEVIYSVYFYSYRVGVRCLEVKEIESFVFMVLRGDRR